MALLVLGLCGSMVAAALFAKERNRTADALADAEDNARQARRQSEIATQNHREAEEATRIAQEQERLARQQRDLTLRNLYLAHVRLAHRDWNVGHVTRMITMLDVHRPRDGLPDQRGWEWYYLASLPEQAESVYAPRIGTIFKLKWSPDGRLVAISGADGGQIYEPASQQVVKAWTGRVDLAWSPDGSRLSVVSYGQNARTIQIVDTREWGVAHTHQTDGFLRFPAWRSDGNAMSWGATDREFALWAIGETQVEFIPYPTPKPFNDPSLYGFSIDAMAWSPGEQLLAFGSRYPQFLTVFDVAAKREIQSHDMNSGGLNALAWRPDGRRLAAASNWGDIYILDVANRAVTARFQGHDGQATACCWSPTGERLVSCGEDNLVRIWDGESGQELRRFSGHRSLVRALDWTSHNDRIVSGGDDGQVRFWQPNASSDYRALVGCTAVAWSPDGNRLATNWPAEADVQSIAIYDPQSAQILTQLSPPAPCTGSPLANVGAFAAIAWSPNGRLVAGSRFCGQIVVWEVATGRVMHSLDAHQPEARCVAWSPDNRLFASCGMDRLLKIWDTASGRLIRSCDEHRESLGSMRWSPNGRWLVSVDWKRNVLLRATRDWGIVAKVDHDAAAIGGGAGGDYVIAWRPNSREFAVISGSGRIVAWHVADNGALQKRWSVDAHTSNIRALDWSPDSKRIASGSEDRSVKIWDAESGSELLAFDDFESMPKSIHWSPDGEKLSAATATSIRIWDASAAYHEQSAKRSGIDD